MLHDIGFLVIVFLSNIIQVITGFAGSLLAMPASMLLIGVNQAKAILNVMGLLSCLWLTIRYHRGINIREFIKITSLMLFGMVGGMFLFQIAPLKILLYFYGTMIILIALKKLFVYRELKFPQTFMFLVILEAGVVHGMFISGGALLVIYAVTVLKNKAEFRATLSPVWVLLNSIMMVIHVRSGYFTPHVQLLTIECIVPLVGSIVIGALLYQKINQSAFLKLTYILLLVSGILLLV